LKKTDSTLSGRIDDLNATDAALKTKDAELSVHVASLNATDAALKGVDEGFANRLDLLNATDAGLKKTDSTLSGRIDDLNATDAELKKTDTALRERIDNLNATDAELKKTDITLSGRIDALNTTDSDLKTRLDALKSRVQSAEDEITTIKSEIASLLSAETDPQVGTVTQDKWCVGTSDGQVECSQESPVSAFPSCFNDGLLTYNGTQYTCRCINGFSGSFCEIPESLSRLETLEMSKVNNTRAVGDSVNDGTNAFSKIVDGDISTVWVSGGRTDEYVEFDLQAAITIVALAIKLPSFSLSQASYLPKDMKLEVSNAGHTGPWVTVKEFQLSLTGRWQIFDIPTFAIRYRYYRLYIVNSHGSDTRKTPMISEVEFFQNNIGTRIAPATDRQNLPRGAIAGVSATDQCHVDLQNRQTYGCSRLSIWPVVAKNPDAWGCESGSFQYTNNYGHMAHTVCTCAEGWQDVSFPTGSYSTMLTCIRV